MRPCKAHFVTSCQQLLALGAVLAVLSPAASVVSLDVVHTPEPSALGPRLLDRPVKADSTERAPKPSRVPIGSVEPEVREVPLTAEADAAPEASPRTATAGRTEVLSRPQPLEGYGAVGVTWSHEDQVENDRIELQVRTSTGGRWGAWTDLEYHDDHAPEPGSDEGAEARPGTDPLLVGEVDLVQTRVVADEGLPDDMSLAVVSPGDADRVATEAPALAPDADAAPATAAGDSDAISLQAATTSAPRPTIYSREQWGADERMRDGSPSYGTISAGFVHHTVNGNDYTRDEVPGIIRSIYAYHTRSRGWSDIGYNFLVDKFGRIWEGRYGGVARAVVGAHTYGYNGDSFAMSAIGNFETAQAPEVMLEAYGSLFAWKLGLHGIDPLDTSQNVNGTTFKAINGHRDADSTACPGRNLYAKLPAIRTYAAAASEPEAPGIELGQVDSDLAGTPYPDLVVRRASDGRGMILPTGGLASFLAPTVLEESGWATRRVLAAPDLTGDGRVDLVTFDDSGSLEVRPGLAAGGFGDVSARFPRFRGHDLVAATGDLDGDGSPDFVGRSAGKLVTFLGTSRGTVTSVAGDTGLRGLQQLVAAGDVTGDGFMDLWGRDRRGRLSLLRGQGGGDFAARARVAGDWSGYDWFSGGTDYTGDALPDLVARRTDRALVVLPGRGDGTLGPALGPVRGPSDLTMVSGAGQVTGDEAPDLVATRPDGSLVVLPNKGTFHTGRPLDTGQGFGRSNLLLHAGDFDGDGHGDVIERRRVGSLWLYRGNGAGRLAAPVWIGGKRPFRTVTDLRVVPDVTGDKRHDLVGRTAAGQTTVWPGNGVERLAAGEPVEVAEGALSRPRLGTSYTWVVGVDDLRGRGAADLVARDRSGQLYRLDGTKRGYGQPQYLGEGVAYDLGG